MRKKIGIFLVSMMLVILTFSSVRIINIETSAGLFEGGTPIAHWHFDEGSGTTAYDSSGNNYHITIYGASWTDGVSGSCLEYDHDYALLTNFNRNIYACNVWLKPQVTITKYSGGTTGGDALVLFRFLINNPLVALGDATIRYEFILGDGTSLVNDETMVINWIGPPEPEPRTAVLDQDITSSEWHMITITWNYSLDRYDIYLDAIKKSVVSSAGGHSDLIHCDDFKICHAYYNYIGKVDEISIYSYPLNENEVLELFNEFKKPVADANGPYSGNVNEPIEFDGSGSYDPDGTIVSYEWNFGDGESGSGVNPTHTYDTPGTYYVILTVEDDDGLKDDDTAQVSIASRPPNNPSTPFGESTLMVYESGTYGTSTTDPDGDQVQYRFDWDADGSHDYSSWTAFVNSGQPSSKSHSWDTAGTYVVKAQAKDVHGLESGWSSGKTVVVTEGEDNDPPNTPSTPSGPNTRETGQSGSYSTSTTDPDGDQVQYRFDWDADGSHDYSSWTIFVNSGQPSSKSHSWSTAGTYVVKAQAKDVHGLESGWSSGKTVVVTEGGDNDPPDIPSIPSGPSNVVVDESGTFSTSATDPDGDQVQYRFDWDADGSGDVSDWTSLDASGHTDSMSHSWSSNGTYVVKAQAKDVHGTMSSWSYGKTVVVSIELNNPPNKPTLTGNTVGKVGQSYTYSASTIDPDGDQLEYWYDWDDDQTSGWLGLYNSGEICEKSHIWDAEGSYSLKVKARDIYGAESEWSDPLSVTMPRNRLINNPMFTKFIEDFMDRFPLFARLLRF